MTAPISKVTIFLEATGGTVPAGWTETYWSAVEDLASLVTFIRQNYVPARSALLGVGAKIVAVRATKNPPTRVSRIAFMQGKEGDPSLFTTSPADDFDPVQVALLCRGVTINGKRRQMWIDGLPDSVTDQLVKTGVLGSFTASPAWKQFVKAVQNSNLLLRFKTANGPPIVYDSEQLTDIQPIMVRNRKRGRPFYLFRGRRLA